MWAMLEIPRSRLAVAVAWGVLALGSGLGLAALAAWLIARAWQMPPVLDLTVAVVAVRALGISRGVCRYLERLATHDVALRSMTAARTSVYRALARAPLWLTRRSDGDLPGVAGTGAGRTAPTAPGGPGLPGRLRRGDVLVRVGTDIDDLGAVVVRTFVPAAVALVLSLAAVGLLAFVSVAAAAILAAALVFSGLVAPWLSARAAADAERAARADRAEFAAHALTVLDHAPELRVAGKLDTALDAATAANRRVLAAEDAAAGRTAWAAAATPLATGVTVLAALLIGITLYGPDGGASGAMTPMALAVLVLLPLSSFEATGALPAAARALTVARAALHRLRAVSPDHRPAGDDMTTGDPARTAARPAGTRKRFGTGGDPHPFPYADSRADGVVIGWVGDGQWQIPERPQASRVVVVGPSGAGKTTLLMAWAGLFDTPDERVRFFAEDAHLFGTSVLENLRVARGDLDAAGADRALRTVGLGDWLDGLADGVHTELTGGAAAVSGGQRRRILLARALVSPARALLLDEPTEHLDATAGAELLCALLDRDSGLVEPDRDVVVVTHQPPIGHRAGLVITVDESGQVRAAFPDRPAGRYALDEIPLPSPACGG
ncbi:thiol reductant ABC exporter subunit CydC [Nocardia sp. NPDC024068]|uniref:thiol reductant ABC exporter subunit CydC n=1 Tax=Nocardia sp. NPDC024068 TaxID=3157197 RepID=UPI0033DF8209